MKRCVVIGLGIFGQNIVREISDKGFEVIAVDKNKEAVQRVRDLAGKAIVADGTDKDLMDQIGIHDDRVVLMDADLVHEVL
ncbi:MAG TPA: NAD-binding protein, partial [Candidatus Aminicenantes bacterium]|nr:NAD-binding protein [Candidatus Aminicenantes bacterium]